MGSVTSSNKRAGYEPNYDLKDSYDSDSDHIEHYPVVRASEENYYFPYNATDQSAKIYIE